MQRESDQHPGGGGGGRFGSILARILTVQLPEDCKWESPTVSTAALDQHSPVGTAHVRLDAMALGRDEHLLDRESQPAERLVLEAALSEAAGNFLESSQQFADLSQRHSRLSAALIVAGHAATQSLGAHHHALTLLILVSIQ
jgi:hypothetical protein